MFRCGSQPAPTSTLATPVNKIHAADTTKTNFDSNNNEQVLKRDDSISAKKSTTEKPKMSQHFREEDFTDYQREKIEELKEKLGQKLLTSTPIFDNDFSLLRWLIGWNYKIDEIIPKFEKASRTLRALNVMDFVIDNIDDLNNYVSNLTTASEYYPGGLMGFDQDGNIISMQRLGGAHPKTLVYCGQTSDAFRLTIIETALIYQLVRLQEQKYRRKLGLRIILDMDGFNSDHLYRPSLKTYGNILKLLQVMAAYKLVQPVLSEQSRNKVTFCGSDYRESLTSSLGADCLFELWGGSKKPTVGHPETGTLRMGGQPPCHKMYKSENNPYHVAESELKKINVSARSKHIVDVDVPDGHHIHWFFLTNGDVDFSIMDQDGYEVYPQLRLTTDFVPEYGVLKCKHHENVQKYQIIFDNSFSKFFSKEIKYFVKIHENLDHLCKKVESKN